MPDIEKLIKALDEFISERCVGCDQCSSTEEICNMVTELKIKLKKNKR